MPWDHISLAPILHFIRFHLLFSHTFNILLTQFCSTRVEYFNLLYFCSQQQSHPNEHNVLLIARQSHLLCVAH